MKIQSLMLNSMSSQLSNIKSTPNQYSELITFLTTNFNIMLEFSKNYLKLLASLTNNYSSAISPATPSANWPEMQKALEGIERRNGESLGLVAKKVTGVLRVVQTSCCCIFRTWRRSYGARAKSQNRPQEKRQDCGGIAEEVHRGESKEQAFDRSTCKAKRRR
eukprot:TRINITY_DN14916_c0_g1_i5.p1 TRINITY_DN14916_c0_g1~~TRINITY_DN14916_c0_g1_i5.p1  ORF type:complete len:163 (-),score=21.45 TRINITY_DN14916_c0_g1_i5:50-538(-)